MSLPKSGAEIHKMYQSYSLPNVFHRNMEYHEAHTTNQIYAYILCKELLSYQKIGKNTFVVGRPFIRVSLFKMPTQQIIEWTRQIHGHGAAKEIPCPMKEFS